MRYRHGMSQEARPTSRSLSSTGCRTPSRCASSRTRARSARRALSAVTSPATTKTCGFFAWLSLILAHCLAATADGGHLLVFSGWRQVRVTSSALAGRGWTGQGTLVWHKPISRPRRSGFKASAEYILWGTNGSSTTPATSICLGGVHRQPTPRPPAPAHHQKPVEWLLDKLVLICPPGGLIPFAGSGSTGVAALAVGRRFIGIELSAANRTIASERLAAGSPGSDRRQLRCGGHFHGVHSSQVATAAAAATTVDNPMIRPRFRQRCHHVSADADGRATLLVGAWTA